MVTQHNEVEICEECSNRRIQKHTDQRYDAAICHLCARDNALVIQPSQNRQYVCTSESDTFSSPAIMSERTHSTLPCMAAFIRAVKPWQFLLSMSNPE